MNVEDARSTSEGIDRIIGLLSEIRQEFGYMNTSYKSVTAIYQMYQTYHDVIVKYGRYPSRNAVLGRDTTAEEGRNSGENWGVMKN